MVRSPIQNSKFKIQNSPLPSGLHDVVERAVPRAEARVPLRDRPVHVVQRVLHRPAQRTAVRESRGDRGGERAAGAVRARRLESSGAATPASRTRQRARPPPRCRSGVLPSAARRPHRAPRARARPRPHLFGRADGAAGQDLRLVQVRRDAGRPAAGAASTIRASASASSSRSPLVATITGSST